MKNSSVPLISTIIVAAAAVALAIVAVVTLNKQPEQQNSSSESSSSSEFRPTQELVEECTYAAHDLVKESYRILRLFVTEGLAHYEEPYGNPPEDGIYTVDSTEFSSLSQIEELVNSIYAEDEAERILTDIDGNGLAVYQNREILVDVTAESGTGDHPLYATETVLGISADFKPDTEYDKDWTSCRIAVMPITADKCELTIYLDGLDENTSVTSDNRDSILDTTMVNTENGWRLAEFVY